ncbi:riboflavin synthase alpha chain [Nakamurella panacisegetis]|uniref:Riboflavin synthase n=1 Tax=Nakamurella panacisegetis TaxID=1090615 RepID=A0A1H0PKH4_9ACTN|nr:riboflavin synthase [Nakamurella panacisegetis]SDP05523.1 riboflavin synthase alpha chain [Nakamurella panacisegetis]
MFTGIVQERGEVVALDLAPDGADARVTVRGPLVTQDVQHGESIAVSGVCLTVVASHEDTFTADVMAETLLRTSAKEWAPGRAVNLERSVTPTTRLGGHVVQGHVDGIGTIVARVPHDGYDEFSISVGKDLARYIASKGAVAVDGISLTVIDVNDSPTGAVFTLGIIPETRTATTLGGAAVGSSVNIEVDVMAKYVERLLSFRDVEKA